MSQTAKYINFYKRTLEKSILINLKPDDALSLKMCNPLRPSACITGWFDTGDSGMSYNRLKINAIFENAKLEVIVAVSDTLEMGDGNTLDLFMADTEISITEKANLLKGLPHVRAVNTLDILLHELKGRYVCIFVGLTPAGVCNCVINGMRLDFPKDCFTKYFPEIYQGDAFFDRYISVFQSILLDIEEQVEKLPQQLDYESASDSQVIELASWLGIDNMNGLFSVEQVRKIIRNIDLYQGKKGTRKALEEVIELACGIKPHIVEYFQYNRPSISEARRKLNAQLYGNGPNQFCVILDLTKYQGGLHIKQNVLSRLIDEYSMIGTRHKLVLLRKNSHTDTHCYLDVNSCLATSELISVDGATLGNYITMG